MVLEDFDADSTELKITRISAVFRAEAGFATFQQVSAYQVSIFSNLSVSNGTLLGDVASLQVAAGSGVSLSQLVDASGDHDYGRVDLDLEISLPAAGHYWVGVAPLSDSTRQFYLTASGPAVSGGQNAWLANPDDGYGLGVGAALNQDYSYSLTAVPEPTSSAVALAALLGLLQRRRG